MFDKLKDSRPAQLVLAAGFGFCFGFLLQKGWVTHYAVIMNQLLLKDFTVLKVMLTAIGIGMVGVHAMSDVGWIELSPKSGSWARDVLGGLVFGVGFALLGYCPGTGVGAAAQGNMDALVGGCTGILLGSGAFGAVYPWMKNHVLGVGDFGDVTLPRLLKINHWVVITGAVLVIVGLLALFESID
ncbi:MAG: YeeE/YedE thiosulfate transporter family protein [Candidatus Brocadiia bacterium]